MANAALLITGGSGNPMDIHSDHNAPTVCVMMSTYNGQKYIREQLDSILGQKDVNVSLFIRDDSSTDGTIEIIREYLKYENVKLIAAAENLGACRSFLRLISTEIDCEYFALADQDDVWDEDKLAVAIKMLRTLPQYKPALYHSNLRVMDLNNNYIRTAHSEPQVEMNRYAFLAVAHATGCTCVYNRKLAEIAWKTKPETYSMHDTWLYNAASMFGNVIYDFEPHMNYRQHESNAIGTPKKYMSLDGIKRQLHSYFDRTSQPRYQCALLMEEQWKDLMNSEQKHMVSMITGYRKSVVNQMKLFCCREMLPAAKYRRIRWRLMILLRNI